MARPSKQGLDYFPFDTDFFSDLKVRKVKKTCGAQSVAVLLHILCTIYRNGYYIPWSDDSSFLIAEELGVDEEEINRILSRCFEVGFLSEEMYRNHHVLTSHGIQRRYVYICKSIRRVCQMTEYCLISSEETAVSSVKTPVSSEETPANLFQFGNSSPSSASVSSGETPISSVKIPIITEETPVSQANGVQITQTPKNVSAEETPNNFGKNAPYKIKENKISSSSYSSLPDSTTTRLSLSSPPRVGSRDLMDELLEAKVPEDDADELRRLTNNFEDGHVGTQALRRWLLTPNSSPYYYLMQQLQQLENNGAIKVSMSREWAQVTRYLRSALKPSDYQIAMGFIHSDGRIFTECRGLIKDCKGGKIKQPGAFIMSRLTKFRQSIQTTINV